MTLLRTGIDSTGKIMGDAAFVDAPDVVKFGGKVWAAPWSPPASLTWEELRFGQLGRSVLRP